MHVADEKLKSILLQSGIISQEVFTSAEEESIRAGQTLANVLIGRGDITEGYLTELAALYFDIPIINLEQLTIAREVLEIVPENYAKSKSLIIFEENKDKKIIKVAMLDPLDYDTIEFLRAKTQYWVEPYFITPSGLKYGLKQYKQKIGAKFTEIILDNVQKFLTAEPGGANLAKMTEAVPIISILNSIIEHAIVLNASDIHFEPMDKGFLVRFRIDGILYEILNLQKKIEPILVARVKILANLQIDEHRVPQDGRFRFELDDATNIDIRVSVMPLMHGEKVEMRLLKSSSRPFSLEELGFAPESIEIVSQEIKKPHGMILVTGPTGHGKTTTLYAILNILNTPKVNITTVEDPIEYEVRRINQTQVNVKAGITFANGLRALLRQNPDIIMVGEIRDNETADIAVNAALTGHLVLSTLHTNDAPTALPRLLDMGAPAFLLSSTINLVIAQRLVRKICNVCTESYPTPKEIEKTIAGQIALTNEAQIKTIPKILFRGKGCKSCDYSGFRGQTGIFEILKITDPIRELLLKHVPIGEIRKEAIKEGMVTMFEDGLRKVEKGLTTIEEVLRVVRE